MRPQRPDRRGPPPPYERQPRRVRTDGHPATEGDSQPRPRPGEGLRLAGTAEGWPPVRTADSIRSGATTTRACCRRGRQRQQSPGDCDRRGRSVADAAYNRTNRQPGRRAAIGGRRAPPGTPDPEPGVPPPAPPRTAGVPARAAWAYPAAWSIHSSHSGRPGGSPTASRSECEAGRRSVGSGPSVGPAGAVRPFDAAAGAPFTLASKDRPDSSAGFSLIRTRCPSLQKVLRAEPRRSASTVRGSLASPPPSAPAVCPSVACG